MTGRNEPTITAAGLVKRYGQTAALHVVGFRADAGTVAVLLGPNKPRWLAGRCPPGRCGRTLTRCYQP